MTNPEHTSIRFGTDGWRGIIAEDFTFDNVRLCAQATATYVKQNKTTADPVVVVGYDTRFGSEAFARTVTGVMAANGIRTILSSSACATPALSYAVAARQASAGIMITASHNPAEWNGFKIKAANGSSAPPDEVSKIEVLIADTPCDCKPDSIDLEEAVSRGLADITDINSGYIARLGEMVDIKTLQGASLKVVFDSMFGSGSGYLSELLKGGQLGVIEINTGPNPAFPGIRQPEPIGPNLQKLSSVVTDIGAGAGLATDGDADRLGIVDENGNFLNTLQVYALLVLYLLEVRGERGAIIKTITSSRMLDRLGELYGVPVYEVPVGFKFVAPAMLKHNAMVGGEESGGYGYRSHIPERDGILSGLFFLDYMVKTGKTPSQLIDSLYSKVGPHYYDRTDLAFPHERRQEILEYVGGAVRHHVAGREVIRKDNIDGTRFTLDDHSWLLIRFSGTEPLLRIYAEASSPERVNELLQEGKVITGL